MTRRSVTLFPTLESAVRQLQASLLTRLDRDVSFTEALNLMLFSAWIDRGVKFVIEEVHPDALKTILDNFGGADLNLNREALLDGLRDNEFDSTFQNIVSASAIIPAV